MEPAFGPGYVEADLLFEGFGGGPFFFFAQALEECQAEWGLLGEFNGPEAEEVGFDGEGVGAEGGTVADVGDAFEGDRARPVADAEVGDVDAVGWK